MRLENRLLDIKGTVMKKISEAAGIYNTNLLVALSEMAKRIDDDERLLATIKARVNEYESVLEKGIHVPLEEKPQVSISRRTVINRAQGRQIGKEVRRSFLDSISSRGYQLTHMSGRMYETDGGKEVLLAFSNETKADGWFFDAPDGGFEILVLLCRSDAGTMFPFIIPVDSLKGYWMSFSRSANLVKLNVSKDGENWYLVIPPRQRLSINGFLDAYGPLKS